MAKTNFSKLGLKNLNNIKEIEYNGNKIEIKQYLPVNDKLNLISEILTISESNDSIKFYNPLQIETLIDLYIIFYYTNINFTDKQKENIDKLYDLLYENNLISTIFSYIPTEEVEKIKHYTKESVEAFSHYKNSAAGILESLQQNSNVLLNEVQDLLKDVQDNQDLKFLKEVMAKLG